MINVCSGRLDSLYYAAKLHIFHQTAKKKPKKPSLTNGIALAGPCELIAGESGGSRENVTALQKNVTALRENVTVLRENATALHLPLLTSHFSPLTLDSLTGKHLAHVAHVAPNSGFAGLGEQEA